MFFLLGVSLYWVCFAFSFSQAGAWGTNALRGGTSAGREETEARKRLSVTYRGVTPIR